MVSLVEGDGYEAARGGVGVGVVGVEDVGCCGCHGGGGLETGVEKP